jgi:Na+-transporting NADH:ubiquinone oxidoreductase subunit NqrB
VAEICSVGDTVFVLTAVVAANAAVESAIIPSAKIVKYFFILVLLLALESPPELPNTRPSPDVPAHC